MNPNRLARVIGGRRSNPSSPERWLMLSEFRELKKRREIARRLPI